MRRIVVGVALGAFGLLLAAAAPHQVLAQRGQEAPAQTPAKAGAGRLGAEFIGLTQQSVVALGLAQPHAVLVVRPASGGPADRVGLQPGDVIVAFDGAPVGPFPI